MGTAVATGGATVGFAAGTSVAVDGGADGAGAPQLARKTGVIPAASSTSAVRLLTPADPRGDAGHPCSSPPTTARECSTFATLPPHTVGPLPVQPSPTVIQKPIAGPWPPAVLVWWIL